MHATWMDRRDYIEWWSNSISKKENKMNLEDRHLKEWPGTRTHTSLFLFPSLSSQDIFLNLLVRSRPPSPSGHPPSRRHRHSLGDAKGTPPSAPKPLTSRCLRSWVAFASDLTALYWLMLRSKDFKQAVDSMPGHSPVSGQGHPLATAASWSRAFFDFLRPRRSGSSCFRFRSASGSLQAASGNSACDWRGWAEGRGSRGAGRWRRGAPQQPPFCRAAARRSAKTRDLARHASAAQLVEGLWGALGRSASGALVPWASSAAALRGLVFVRVSLCLDTAAPLV